MAGAYPNEFSVNAFCDSGARDYARRVHSGLFRTVLLGLPLLLFVPGCRDKTGSDYVADQFADAYFRRMDQDAALHYTALGATEMLDKELRDTKAIRESGYTPAAAAAAGVTYTRGLAVPRDKRVGYHYVITVQNPDSEPAKHEADVELSQIAGGWKVVSVRMTK
jgi:hypothetical protein